MTVSARLSISGLLKAGVLVIAANIIFFLLVFIVDASLDHHVIFDRLADAAAHGVINDQDNPPDLATYSDRFTDCVAMSLNMHDGTDRTALQLIRDSEVSMVDGLGACAGLMTTLKNPQSIGTMYYGRYWHGYQILSKPFLRFGDIRDLRYILACLVIGAVFVYATTVATALAGAADGPLYGLWFAVGYLLLTDVANLANVFTHALSLVMIFALPIAAFWAIRARVKCSLLLVAVAIGCVNSFFDLLFNPPLGLSTLVVAVAAASSSENPSVRDIVRMIAVVAFGWAIGFFGTYFCRFAIDVLLSEAPLATLRQIIASGLFRISGMEDKIKPVVFWATIKNFGFPMLKPSFAVFVIITGAFAAVLRTKGYRFAPRPVLLALLAPSFLSVLWFEILRNHSQHHHWFTYRSASFSLLCLAAAIMFCLSKGRQSIEDSDQRRALVAQPGKLNV
jgi:hypothetical protein